MNPKTELLRILSVALSRGQGGFTEEELAIAFKEVHKMLIQGQIGILVLEGELNLSIKDGTVLYTAAANEDEPGEALPLETLIENMGKAEGT
jgi:hypothetical protein